MSDVNLHTMLPMPPFKSMDMMYEAIARGSVTLSSCIAYIARLQPVSLGKQDSAVNIVESKK